ncbi:YbhB/YbcL family Raf kinase inhibitor-like protein [Mycoplasma phocoenae]|uniref:YbhB/YbcL family Raf kinase inhibitor-like protein n=1 Tax=Mycoplasma phocoenae TaxID=754517 RepID=A0A858U3M0_9MOLU|nr:YbhB/YbcL family Raf kinase inhibitor-like protein [Mycoplasma phocoenae]QJG67070.1 YbhB/YbcL family Raf kinase inhibitor-like protein [Mycoplasma phocoenae]
MRVYSKTVNVYNVIEDINGLGSPHSPHIGWDEVKNAKSYAVSIIDHEACGVAGLSFIHWGVLNIKGDHICRDSSIRKAKELFQIENSLSKKALNPLIHQSSLIDNANSYYGPKPPDQDHVYEVRVYALDFEHVSEVWDIEKPMFWKDFDNIVAEHKIDSGVLTFSSQKAIEENGKCYHEESATHGLFYVLNENDELEELRVSMTDFEKDEQGNFWLDKQFYLETSNTADWANKNSPAFKIKNIKGVKEYAIFVFNNNTSKEWSLVSCEYAVLGIRSQKGDWTIIEKNDLNSKDRTRLPINNSYSETTIVPKNIKQLYKNRQSKWNVTMHNEFAENNSNHVMMIFALDQTITTRDQALNPADAYRFVKNKVIGEKIIRFKLKK